jgi:hypothetical protein
VSPLALAIAEAFCASFRVNCPSGVKTGAAPGAPSVEQAVRVARTARVISSVFIKLAL